MNPEIASLPEARGERRSLSRVNFGARSATSLKELFETGIGLVLLVLARVLPEPAAEGLGALAGAAAGTVLGGRRRVVLQNLSIAFPDRSDGWRRSIARESWRHLGRELVTAARFSRLDLKERASRTVFVGMEHLERAREDGRGVILATAHLGNWEVGAAAFNARGIALEAVAKPLRNRRLNRWLFESRQRVGMSVIDVDAAARRVPRALRAGGIVVIPGDQNPAAGGVLAPFFGRDAQTALGAAIFASRLRVGALFVYAVRDEGRTTHMGRTTHAGRTTHTVVIEPLEPERDNPASFLAAYHSALERAIRRRPGQYFWQHRRWKPRPGVVSGREPPTPPPV